MEVVLESTSSSNSPGRGRSALMIEYCTTHRPGESGFVVLGDLTLETSTDPDDGLPTGPPSPCNGEFANAYIVINGKSSMRNKTSRSNKAIFWLGIVPVWVGEEISGGLRTGTILLRVHSSHGSQKWQATRPLEIEEPKKKKIVSIYIKVFLKYLGHLGLSPCKLVAWGV
uniref:Uncharacterized protein n=1 Tax=Anopheles culicifacies TaxID=139723 RepID=A0A182M354_9DIPT